MDFLELRQARGVYSRVATGMPIFDLKWRPRAFSRVSTGDSDILSSCDMNDEHA